MDSYDEEADMVEENSRYSNKDGCDPKTIR